MTQSVASKEVQEKNEKETKQPLPESPTTRTTKRIAFLLLGLYAVSLLLALLAAIYEDPSSNRVWFELFKNGFLLLGGALTTVIGYYFGSRGLQEAEMSASIAQQEAERRAREAERAKADLEPLRKKIKDLKSPTYDEVTLEEGLEEE